MSDLESELEWMNDKNDDKSLEWLGQVGTDATFAASRLRGSRSHEFREPQTGDPLGLGRPDNFKLLPNGAGDASFVSQQTLAEDLGVSVRHAPARSVLNRLPLRHLDVPGNAGLALPA